MKPTSQRWLADADQYQKQVDEARSKGLPHDQMLATMGTLRACAKEMAAAEARISELEAKLAVAKSELNSWRTYGTGGDYNGD